MKYALYFITSICILLMLCCLVYFSILAVLTLATLLAGYTLLPGLVLAVLGAFFLRRTLLVLRQGRIALATITRLTLNASGKRTYQVQFTTRSNETILTELAAKNDSRWHKLQHFFLTLYDAQPVCGSRFPLLYDKATPDKNPRRLSFIDAWLGPILLFWFAFLLLMLGTTLWLSS